ncbi:MAG: right-handed parallel beta-helix repeat-containing protein [Verrucomicrobiota bacterium]
MSHLKHLLLTTALLFTPGHLFAQGGPLSPPPTALSGGTPVPNFKTLHEIEPRTPIHPATTYPIVISAPGSYYLTDNLHVTTTADAIQIAAARVQLDLAGHSITKDLSNDGTGNGIFIATGGSLVTIENGNVSGFNDGISRTSGTSSARFAIIRNVKAEGCSNNGFYLPAGSIVEKCLAQNNDHCGLEVGPFSIVQNCVASGNGDAGIIIAGISGQITNCNSSDNDGAGFAADADCSATSCTASSNDGDGFDIGANSQITECRSIKNNIGIETGDRCLISDSVSAQNSSSGIIAGLGSTIKECTVTDNQGDDGIRAGQGNSVIDSTSHRNVGIGILLTGTGDHLVKNCTVTSNTLDGINGSAVESNTEIAGCNASRNGGDGIQIGGGGRIFHCTTSKNGASGINISNDNYIAWNTAADNTANGFVVSGDDNRLDSNHSSNNATGFDIDGTENLIIRNSAVDNPNDAGASNYSIVAGNDDAALITNPGTGFTTTNPFANFSF